MSDDDTAALAEAAARGDAVAIETLLERHMPGLRAFVRLRAGDELRRRESNSDLVQSVCREVLQNMDRFRHPTATAFRRWLYTTAMRKIVNRAEYWRAEKRAAAQDALAPSAVDQRRLLSCYESFSSPSRHVMVKEEIERVERAFGDLTDEQRQVVTLAHVVGLSRAEIAAELGLSEGNVRVILHRALARLSEILSD